MTIKIQFLDRRCQLTIPEFNDTRGLNMFTTLRSRFAEIRAPNSDDVAT